MSAPGNLAAGERAAGLPVPLPKEVLDRLDDELHDLCQPLAALQCRLELGGMIGDAEALREAVEGSLTDTARMFAKVAEMRARLFGVQGPARASNGN